MEEGRRRRTAGWWGGGLTAANGPTPPVGTHHRVQPRSLFDDPGKVSCLLPLPIAIKPRYNRWALCRQEYCFNGALPGLVHGYISAGQVLPIRRGGGIDQRLLLDFARHLVWGEWCHVSPEGGGSSGTSWGGGGDCRTVRCLCRRPTLASASASVLARTEEEAAATATGMRRCGSSPRPRDSGSSPPRPSRN